MVDEVVCGHILVKMNRDTETSYGWVVERDFYDDLDYYEAVLLNDAYQFVCKQRLLEFLVPSSSDEITKMLCKHYMPISFEQGRHPDHYRAYFELGGKLLRKYNPDYFRD